MANSICKQCKFYDRCDEPALMRSYVTAANKEGCSHYGMLSAFDDVEERQNQMWAKRAEEERRRRQAEFDERIGEEEAKVEAALERVDEQLDQIAAQYSILKEPTENMGEAIYGYSYFQWQQIRSQIKPFDDEAIARYNRFLDRFESIDHGYKHKDPKALYKLYLQKIDEILQDYRDYGLTGAGSQREDIHKQAVQWQEAVDKKKAEEEQKAKEERRKKEEEKKRKQAQEAEERRKEQERLEEEKRKKRAFWKPLIIAAIVVFVIGLIIPPIMGIGLLGVGIAGVVRYFRLKNKQND